MVYTTFNQKLTCLPERLESLLQQTKEIPNVLENLWQRADEFSGQTQELLTQSLQELSYTLQELQQTAEELRQENDQLAESRIALELERQEYLELFELAPNGYLVTDQHATILKANRAVAQLFNVAQDYLVGKPLANYVALTERQSFRAKLNQIQQGESVKPWQVRIQPPQYDALAVVITVTPIANNESQVQKLRWGLIELDEMASQPQSDTSNLAMTTQKPEDSYTFHAQTVNALIHRIRDSLSTLSITTQLLETQCKSRPEEKQLNRFQLIPMNIQRIDRLLSEFALMGKIEAGEIKLNPVLLDIRQFCYKLIGELQQSEVGQHCIKFTSEGLGPSTWLDQQLLRPILTNLLVNAREFSPKGSEIKFKITHQNRHTIFLVQYLGDGVSKKTQKILSEPLLEGSKINTASSHGSKWAVVKQCVDLLRGTISIERKGNVGTTFTLTVPSILPEQNIALRTKVRTSS
ncbi:MAG TPA: PAS domain-containing sensor histidine kinase [Waterburya sp.]